MLQHPDWAGSKHIEQGGQTQGINFEQAVKIPDDASGVPTAKTTP